MANSMRTAVAVLLCALVAQPVLAQAPQPAAEVLIQPDLRRLVLDRAYAEQVLTEADAMLPRVSGNGELEALVHALRAAALATLDRHAESEAALRAMLQREPVSVYSYGVGWIAAARLPGPDPLLDFVTLAARRVPEPARPFLHRLFQFDIILWLHHRLRNAGDDAKMLRLTQALVGIGWPGENDPTGGDIFRMALVDHHLERGERVSAARFAALVHGPESLQMLVLARRYEDLLPSWSRPVAAIEEAYARFDATTRGAVAAAPRNFRYILQRARLLRSLSRDTEALSLLAPLAAAPEQTYEEQAEGDLVLTETVQVLLALGRTDEAVALSARVAAIDKAGRNSGRARERHAWLLWQAGRPSESVTEARRLIAEPDSPLTRSARSSVEATLVCGLTSLGRGAEAEPHLQRLLAERDGVPLTLALLCANRLDEVEALALARLRSDAPILALLLMQDYRPGGVDAGPAAMLYQRVRAVRSRPAVAAALDRAGRVVRLPVVRIFPQTF